VHELSITRSVVAICAEHSNGARVKRVTLEIGKLSSIVPDAIRFCFDICAKATTVEGAALDIIEVPGLARCGDCGGDVALVDIVGRCECGSRNLKVIAGEELKIREMEVA
jgi:hydrogenase nickel incorporation protein HypA/HybF